MPVYTPAWNLFLLLAGLVDPIYGILIKCLDIFWRPPLPELADTPRRRRRGLTIILGGIEGPSLYNQRMVVGILRSGYRGAVVRIDWNDGITVWRSLVNLMRRAHQERQARHVAEFIESYLAEHPRTRVNIVAQSGGCWIAIRALELLPADAGIGGVALIAPAISPGYDIRPAVSRCRGILSVGSPGDYFFLGLGTLLLGTADRVFSPAAGLVGWHYKPPAFVEARWHPHWLRHGFIGNHTTSATARFVAKVVAPWINASVTS